MRNPLARDLDHVLAHTAGVWEELRRARIFLTGGTGFFGCWLLESFAAAYDRWDLDASVTVLTRSPEAFRTKAPHLAGHPGIELLRGDVQTFSFPGGRFTHVVHAATEASAQVSRDEPRRMRQTIVEGTRRTLELAVSAGAERVLLTSSGAVCGDWDPGDPRAIYAEGKRAAEELCRSYAQQHGIACPIARGFAFVGPYQALTIHYAIGNFIGDCLASRAIEIHGDGTPYRSYLYAADLAIWLWTILARGDSRPYNVGSERAVAIADLAVTVAQVLGRMVPIRVARIPVAGATAERYVPDTSHTRTELGLDEWIPLEEAIRRTAEWHSPAGALTRGAGRP
ncbi:MAG TPA: NAD(P)-dependent oxidoreductase [Bryobacteraceae bacterium]|nr:NAD(P)-dependent oxidoreductase [Bryobacteraceae bacterium]